jgi:glycosyltransferase involved in cell wall biosynthesis
VVIGSGPGEAELRAQARRVGAPVVFAGFRNQSELPACYAAMDALVLPSAEESWGLVVNEAMAAGVPAIVSDRVGAGLDLIQEGATGLTSVAGNPASLSERMLQLAHRIRTDHGALTAAVAARISQYSIDRAVSAIVDAIEPRGERRRAALGAGRGHG